MTLTTEQRAVAEHPAQSLVVCAPPGSGKTTTLTARLLFWLRSGVPPSSILAICFTRAAAATIAARIAAELPGQEQPLVRTIHALASARILPAGYNVATEDEDELAIRSLYEGSDRRPSRDLPGIDTLRDEIARHEAGLPPSSGVGEHAVRLILYRLGERKLWPLWSLVPRALAGLRRDGGRFARVALDEHQDVTPNEGAFARELAGEGFTAVGDRAQSIMGWKYGAGLELQDGDEQAALTRTFRFGPAIAAEVNRIGARFGAWPVVPLDGIPGEAYSTHWGELEKELRIAVGRTLILARTNHECSRIVWKLGGSRVEHVVRSSDPLGASIDRFAATWARGRAVVSTVHAAKGTEAELVVTVMDMESEVKEPEENRVRYVAASRARVRLINIQPTEEITSWRP